MARRHAFTLIELLVVISIIGILMALLLPAVNNAVEAARQTQCMNNQRQFSTASITYEASFNKYPGWVNREVTGNATRRIPWTIALFPYMDNNELFKQYAKGAPPSAAPEIPVFICPTNPPETRGQPRNAYVMNCGQNGVNNPANGVGLDRSTAQSPYINADYVKSGDGLANTIIFSENMLAGDWTDNLDSAEASKQGQIRQGFVWHADGFSPPSDPSLGALRRINGSKQTVTSLNANTARPSSYHHGGVVVAFLDNHILFIPETIDFHVYCQLMTTNNTKSTAPDTHPINVKAYVLSAGDYQ